MRNDKILQHQLRRINRLLPQFTIDWGRVCPKGERLMDMAYRAVIRSIERFEASL